MSILRVNICLNKHGPGTNTVVTKHVYRPRETDIKWEWDAYLPLKELKLRQAVQGPLRRRWTFWIMPSLSLVQQCALPKNWPFFRSRTSDNTAQCPTMETLFLGSMLMIIIVTNHAWEPVSQDLYPWSHSNSMSIPEMLPGTHSPWLIISGCMPWEMVWWNFYNIEVFFLSIFSSKLKSI